jgi:hypothetical protein
MNIFTYNEELETRKGHNSVLKFRKTFKIKYGRGWGFSIGFFNEYLSKSDLKWRESGIAKILSIDKFKIGSDHFYYDGPNCSLHLGFFHFYWNNWSCKKCLPIKQEMKNE